MRDRPHSEAEKGRAQMPPYESPAGANYGAFVLRRPGGVYLKVLASDGLGEEGTPHPDYPWEHVSVSLPDRCPTHDELTWVKGLFWTPEETVVHFWVPSADHRNLHPFCLHLWRWLGGEFPRPPAYLVA